jgi:hypothetical protein
MNVFAKLEDPMGDLGNFLEGLEKIKETITQVRQCSSQDSNQVPPKYIRYTSAMTTYTVN